MNLTLNKKQIERFSRQIILKDIGAIGQKKIIKSKVLIIGMGGLGCPVAEFLTSFCYKLFLKNVSRDSSFSSFTRKLLKLFHHCV